MTELPPVSPPFIWYAHAESKEFPLVGSGGQIAMPGPVFYSEDFKHVKRPFPDYYNGKLLIYDGIRGWIMAVSIDKDGNYAGMEPFMGGHKFSMPMDMVFGTEGDLYLLEYGFGSPGGSLARIEYTAGNRKPEARIAARKTQGAVPFTTHFDSNETADADGDDLKFSWKGHSPEGQLLQTTTLPYLDVTFEKPGVYQVELTVQDGKGGESVTTTRVQAGNEPPIVELAITRGNTSLFFPGQSLNYQVNVKDKEDGSSDSRSFPPDAVRVTIEYLAGGD
jgi:cytochrome c